MHAVATLLALSALAASPRPIARVNDEPISSERLRREFGRAHQGHERMVVAGVSEARQFLDKLVDKILLVQEAYRVDLQASPEIAKVVSAFELQRITEHLRKVEIDDPSRPSDAQVKAIYDAHTKELRDLRQIVCDTREQADRARARVAGGEAMDKVAREVSTAKSKGVGGFLPRIGWGALEPAAEELYLGIAEGALTPVHQVKEGWQILKVEKVEKITQPPWEKAEPPIRSILTARNREERQRSFQKALLAKYQVTFPQADLSLAALKAAEKGKKEDVAVATWKGGKLSAAAFASTLAFDRLEPLRPAQQERAIREVLEGAAVGKLVGEEARGRGYAKLPEVVMAVREQREDQMFRALQLEFIGAGVKITEDEVKAYYTSHKGEMVVPERRLVAHIQVESQELAREVREKIRKGESFDALVKAYSKNENTSKNAGDLGWTTRAETPAEFMSVFTLGKGEPSEPVQGNGAWQVLLVREIDPSREIPFDEIRDGLRKKLLDERFADKRRDWVQRLRKASRIEVNEKAFQAFVKASEKEAAELEKRGPPKMGAGHGAPGGGMPGHGAPGGGMPGHGGPH